MINRAVIEIEVDGVGGQVNCRVEHMQHPMLPAGSRQIRETRADLIAILIHARARELMRMSEDDLKRERENLLKAGQVF